MISVKVYPPILGGTGASFDVIKNCEEWTRSIRAQGGYWQGEFTLTGEKDKLTRYFNEWLGYHVEERSGGVVTWEGIIYEMDHSYSSGDMTVTRKRTLDDMYNSVKCTYTLTDGTTQTTSAAENAVSIAKYGKREGITELSRGQHSAAAAVAAKTRFLLENQWPLAKPVDTVLGEGENKLTVTVCGYIFTANWRYVSVAGAAGNASDYIKSILTTDCQFITAGNITANTLSVKPDNTNRAYDTIAEYASLGDDTSDKHQPWRFYVGAGRKAYYEEMSTTPSYYLRNGHLYTVSGSHVERDPWRVTPGVVRDMSYPVSTPEYYNWLADKRDFWIDEVETSTSGGLALKSSVYTESDIISAQANYADSIYAARNRTIFEKMGVPAREWERMSPERRRAYGESWKKMQPGQRQYVKVRKGRRSLG